MKNLLTYQEFLNEDKESNPEKRIADLANDSKTHNQLDNSDVNKLKQALLVVFKRGYAAAQTNWASVRPQITALGKPGAYFAWAYARVNAFINKQTCYHTSDKDVADWLKGKGEKPKSKQE